MLGTLEAILYGAGVNILRGGSGEPGPGQLLGSTTLQALQGDIGHGEVVADTV